MRTLLEKSLRTLTDYPPAHFTTIANIVMLSTINSFIHLKEIQAFLSLAEAPIALWFGGDSRKTRNAVGCVNRRTGTRRRQNGSAEDDGKQK